MEILKKAFEIAKKAQERAYAPYSKFKVGAALITEDGKVFSGHNIENSSFGATVCAERVAVWKAISNETKAHKFKKIVLVTDPVARPCGLCLQVFSEFCEEDFEVHLATPNKVVEVITFKDLLPKPFGPKDFLK